MGAMGGGSRPRLLYSSKHFLLVLVGNSSIVLGLQLCLLLLVCLLCISKDVHEMFTLVMVSLNELEKRRNEVLTVLTTLPDLFRIVTVSTRGILAVLY